MSANLDHIDLNSDVVSVEPENNVHTVNPSESTDRLGLSDAETLTDPIIDQGQAQEAVGNEVRGFEGANDSNEVVVDGVGSEGFERKVESVDRGNNLEAEIASVESRSEAKIGVVDASTNELPKDTEAETESISDKVEEEVKDGTSVEMGSSLGVKDVMQIESDGATGLVNEELKLVANTHDVYAKLTSDGHDENQRMEIDELGKASVGTNVSDDWVFVEYDNHDDNNNSNELNLVVDLKPCVSMDGRMTVDLNGKDGVSRREFSVSDLVWGKVRSHPWWPGQIFDPSDASEKAKKYFKKDGYLIAYFGDQTFAWNEASMIKPFLPHFSQMVKQSNSEDFHYAIQCALDEVSRRIEFGLACSCIPEYSKIRTQIIVNAGIREESNRRDGKDSVSSAASFEPVKLIEYVKALGESPFGEVDRLEFVSAKAQLLAFNRWNGYSHLPEFHILSAWLESDVEIPLSTEVKHGNEVNENASTEVEDNEQVSSGKVNSKSNDILSRKRRKVSGDGVYPIKKEKSLAQLIAERHVMVLNGKGRLDKTTSKLNSSSSGKKRKAVDSFSDDSVAKQNKNLSTSGGDGNSSQPKRTFRVGDSILRVASQLNGPIPMLKTVNGMSLKNVEKNKSQEKSLSGKYQGNILFPTEDSSPNEMVSQLCLVAREPKKGCRFLESVVSFFVEFRNSVCLDHHSSQQHKKSFLERVSCANIGKVLPESETETSESEHMKDSCCSDMVIQSQNESGELHPETPAKGGILTVEPQSPVQGSFNLDSEQQTAGGILDLEAVKPVDLLKEDCNGDSSPTALILNFTDLDSVPSKTNLNKIFGHFGPLKESETEVLKKSCRAKVVFCKRADAEAAFSSAGKYSTFGPSLVSYRLKYTTSSPAKAAKCSKKDATTAEGNAT